MDTNEVVIQLSQAQQVARTMAMVDDMHTRLFGNGQPGILKEMQDDIDSLKESRSHAKGAFSVLTVALGLVGWTHVRDLFTK